MYRRSVEGKGSLGGKRNKERRRNGKNSLRARRICVLTQANLRASQPRTGGIQKIYRCLREMDVLCLWGLRLDGLLARAQRTASWRAHAVVRYLRKFDRAQHMLINAKHRYFTGSIDRRRTPELIVADTASISTCSTSCWWLACELPQTGSWELDLVIDFPLVVYERR